MKKEKLNILLIQPRWEGLSFRRKIKVDEQRIHPLGVGVVAALCGRHDVRVVDEAIEEVPRFDNFDLVGISVNTYTACRAFALAEKARAQGVFVVLGGVHTAFMSDECLRYADSVVIGDAEDTWPILLEEFTSGVVQRVYRSTRVCAGKDVPAPRRDLFKHMRRDVAYCQASRGCANTCKFCYLQYLPSKKFRARDIDEVYNELAALPQKVVLFVDDNLFCDREYAIALFRRIRPLGKKWWIQAPTNIVNDEALVQELAAAGCFSVSVGFQTACSNTLASESILQNNVDRYLALVEMLHRYHVIVDGTFIFGFDGDDKETFTETERMIRHIGLDTYTFYFFTPYPGTEPFEKYQQSGRITGKAHSDFDWEHVVIKPARLGEAELRDQVDRLYARLDRTHYIQTIMRNRGIYRHHFSSPEVMKFLLSTGWRYITSPRILS